MLKRFTILKCLSHCTKQRCQMRAFSAVTWASCPRPTTFGAQYRVPVIFGPQLTHPAARFLCDSWATCLYPQVVEIPGLKSNQWSGYKCSSDASYDIRSALQMLQLLANDSRLDSTVHTVTVTATCSEPSRVPARHCTVHVIRSLLHQFHVICRLSYLFAKY